MKTGYYPYAGIERGLIKMEIPISPYIFGNNQDSAADSILPIVLDMFDVNSVVDFGCGNCGWLKAAENLGVQEVRGVDSSIAGTTAIHPENIVKRDLTAPIDLGQRYDLVMSMEVAQNLPRGSEDIFVDTLCRHGDLVLFSSAIVGHILEQRGGNSSNEQFLSYWVAKFLKKGYVVADVIRPKIWNDDNIELCYRQDTLLFVNRENEELIKKVDTEAEFIDAIHLGYYRGILRHNGQMGDMYAKSLVKIEEMKRNQAEILLFSINQSLKTLLKYDEMDKDLLTHFRIEDIVYCVDNFDEDKREDLRAKVAAYYRNLGDEENAKTFDKHSEQ